VSDLWVEASIDVEARDSALRMMQNKVAVASVWPFLALAQSESEFEHRLALAMDRITEKVESSVLDGLVASLREDYQMLVGPAEGNAEESLKPRQSSLSTQAEADPLWSEFHGTETPQEQGQRQGGELWEGLSHGLGFADSDHMKTNSQNESMMDLHRNYAGGTGRFAFDENGDPNYTVQHPQGWTARDFGGPDLQVGHVATGNDVHDAIDVSDERGQRVPGIKEHHLHAVLGDWANEHGDEYANHLGRTDPRMGRWNRQHRASVAPQQTEPMQVFHVASGRWVTVQAAAQPAPPEAGPETNNTGGFPVEVDGPDPWNPMNGTMPLPPNSAVEPANRFPAEPQPWTVPPNAGWVDRPMNLQQQAAVGDPRYVDEGVETGPGPNPNFFGQGTTGLTGDGYAPNVSLEEPDERVDMYGTVQPEQSTGTGPGQTRGYSNKESAFRGTRVTTQFFDPTDRSVRMMHTADDTSSDTSDDLMSDNPFTPTDTSSTDDSASTPTPPPSMTQGGPGAEAMPPSGSGSDDPSGSDAAAKTSIRHHADDVRERPTMFNPSGAGDEYTSNTWEGPLKTAPRQGPEERGINTPQQAQRPIPQNSSSNGGQGQMDEDEEEEEDEGRREAARRYLFSVASFAASHAMAEAAR
jgi:hypothetical protein